MRLDRPPRYPASLYQLENLKKTRVSLYNIYLLVPIALAFGLSTTTSIPTLHNVCGVAIAGCTDEYKIKRKRYNYNAYCLKLIIARLGRRREEKNNKVELIGGLPELAWRV